MWSYQDTEGEEHHRLSQTDIESLIQRKVITETTLLKKQELVHWVQAKNSTFFAQDQPLPTAKKEEIVAPKPPPPGTVKARPKERNTVSIIPFLIASTLAISALLYFSIVFLLKDKEISVAQFSIDSHSDQIYRRDLAQDKLDKVDNQINDLIKQSSTEGKTINWTLPRVKKITTQKTKIENELAQYSILSDEAPASTRMKKLQVEGNSIILQSHWVALGLLLPLLMTLRHHYKGSRVLTTSIILRSFLTCFMMVPLLHIFGYLLYSAKWNLEGAQRKNAIITTLPLCLATLVCGFLIYYHYFTQPQYSLFSLGFVAILWTVIHFRFLQMINYFYRQILRAPRTKQKKINPKTPSRV